MRAGRSNDRQRKNLVTMSFKKEENINLKHNYKNDIVRLKKKVQKEFGFWNQGRMTDEQIIQKAKEYLVKNDLDCDEIGHGADVNDWLKDGYFMVVGEQNECCYFVPMKKATEDRVLWVDSCLGCPKVHQSRLSLP